MCGGDAAPDSVQEALIELRMARVLCFDPLMLNALDRGITQIEVLCAAMQGLLASDVGCQTMQKLNEGQGAHTDDGKAWLHAAALMRFPLAETNNQREAD